MKEIKKIAILGANGTMGSLSGGLFAQAGITCIFFARSPEKAQRGIENAVKQARSDVLREYIIPKTYESLEEEIPQCDWILEAVAENLPLKREYFRRIDGLRKRDSIISTISSSLSIEDMAEECSDDFKAHFMGVHFFNPPGKLLANELVFLSQNSEKLKSFVADFCKRVLMRVNIAVYNRPGFAGNRIGFQLLNEAARYAEKYGVEEIDYLIGPYTGRALAPLATIDLVGLDVHKEIVNNIYQNVQDERHDSFQLPEYVQKMLDKKMLGNKNREAGGFYRYSEKKEKYALDPLNIQFKSMKNTKHEVIENIKTHIHDGNYKKAVDLIKYGKSDEISLVKQFILGYISYSYSRIGEVTPVEEDIHGIDRVMSYGFSWLPPSAWVDYFGGPRETVKLLDKYDMPVPQHLKNTPEERQCRIPEVTKYFVAH